MPVELGQHYLADGAGQKLMPLADFIDNFIGIGAGHTSGDDGGGSSPQPDKDKHLARGKPKRVSKDSARKGDLVKLEKLKEAEKECTKTSAELRQAKAELSRVRA